MVKLLFSLVECIEMEGSEDENEDKIEQTQTESSQSSNDQSNVLILFDNNEQNAQISSENTVKMDSKSNSTTTPASKCIRIFRNSNSGRCPMTDDSSDVPLEVNLIVVGEQKMDQTIESNENEQTSAASKRVRLEIEPAPNAVIKSSQNEVKNPTTSAEAIRFGRTGKKRRRACVID